MKVIIFAILAGCAAAGTHVLNKSGMKYVNPITGTFMLITFTWLVTLVLFLISQQQKSLLNIELKAFLIWGVDGLLSFLFLFLLLSAYQYGIVSVVAPIQTPIGLLFGIILAVFVLKEQLTLQRGLGITAIIAGMILIAKSQPH